jgi:hypothetical protein
MAIEKLSEDRINTLINVYEQLKYVTSGIYQYRDEILACLLEVKQLRAEKRFNGNGQKDQG